MAKVTLAALLLIVAAIAFGQQPTPAPAGDWNPVESAMGRKGQPQPGGVFKFSMPRSDLKVTVDGTPIQAGLALGSWSAFKHVNSQAVVMGDLVVTEKEVEPVMTRLEQQGIQVTAVHNHLLNEQPRVMYMHIFGHGEAVQLARALNAALALTGTPAAAASSGTPRQSLLNVEQIARALGRTGKLNGDIYQVAVPRAERISDHGVELPAAMGVATSLNFQAVGATAAVTTGDFVLVANEVNPVIRELRSHGIAVTAVHSHMLTEEPRLFFLHFWGEGDAVKLAEGLRAALDQTNSAKPRP